MNKTKSNLKRAAMTLLLALLCSTGTWAETKAAVAPPPIAVVSDIHVMAPSLLPEGAETQETWTTYYAGQRKMLQQSAAIFTQFVDDMINQSPQVVLITGDLTKDGETASHEFVREQLDRLTNMGIKVFVIPGNHDFGESGTPTKFNADGTTETAEVMTYGEFKDFYYNFGYGWDSEFDSNSLSYVTEIMENLVLLAIDSHTTSIPAATLTWLCEKAKAARNAGKQVIAMMHHPLFPHITGADLFIDTYTVNNYETVRNALIDAGVNVILTGHFHTSDIAKDWNDDEGKAVYDVNTGSLISYPCDYRMLTPSYDNTTLKVETKSIVPAGMSKEECKTWLQGRMKGAATEKMNAKAGAMAAMAAEPISNIAEFAANLFVLHAEGDENASADREGLVTTYTTFKGNALYNAALAYGGITDASIYSVIDDKSNYGTDKENQTADRSLSITMPEVGPFKDNSPGTITIGSGDNWTDLPITAQYNYAVTQQVFSAEEINHGKGKIWSLAFKTHTGDLKRNLTVYLTHRDYASVSLHPVTEADQVFKGEVMFTAGQWNTIYFDRPFEYDGKSSIIVTVDDNTGTAEGWGSLQNYYFYGDGGHAIARDNNKDIDPLDEASIENANKRDSYQYKAQIQFTFGEYPVPASLTVNAGDVSAEVACTLRGDATAWNVRYRKVAKEGEEEQRYVAINDLTDLSTTLTDLTPATKYEVQVQAIFPEDNLSEWSDPVIFTTACCPVEQQVEIMFALNSQYIEWYGYAVQIVDVTEETNPVEVAYLQAPSYKAYSGTVTLCCDHKYQVNWIYDADKAVYSQSYYFSLYYPQGDLIYSMARGEAPEETAELTRFVMDCTDYCAPMPKNLTIDDVFYNGAAISFTSATAGGNVAYSTEADFNPATATNTQSVTFVAEGDGTGGSSYSYRLTGLEPLTDYYVAVQSLCSAQLLDDGGKSRWTKPVKVKTGPEEAPVEDITVVNDGSSKSKVSWTPKGTETKHNVYVRRQTGEGKPISSDQIMMFNLQDEEGETFENWGGGIWSSLASSSFSNILQEVSKWFVVTGLQEGDVVKAIVSEGNSKSDPNAKVKVTETYSMGAESLTKGLDAEAKKAEVKLKIKNRRSQRNSGKILTKDQWKKKYQEYEELEDQWDSAEEGSEEEKALNEQIKTYKRELGLDKRKVRKAARRSMRTGYKYYKKYAKKRTKTRGIDDEQDEYFVWINHEEGSGYLSISDLEIVSEDDWSEWEVIEGVSGNSYTFNGLTPGTTYEIIIEPVYDDGTTGSENSILFTTLGEDTDPVEGEFSVAEDKKVQFARGNLQHTGDMYEGTWSMAKQQYEMLGQNNVDKHENGDSYTADLVDLFCWSTAKNYNGLSFFSYYEEEDAKTYFQGDFEDWGTNASLISDLGSGWSTLSKDEWDYLLNERKNAASLKAFATVAGVQGLILLPDDWTEEAPAGTFTAEEWAMLEKDGAVFLPTAGQMTQTYDEANYQTTTTVSNEGIEGFYWTSTPFDDNDGLNAFTLNFSSTNATSETDIFRRTASAVRLVKLAEAKMKDADANGDGEVNVADVDFVIESIGEDYETHKAADVNGDGEINVADIDYIIERIN